MVIISQSDLVKEMSVTMNKSVVELFAGVGGFRVGLNNVNLNMHDEVNENRTFDFVWANQWEPSTKSQDAFDCYQKRFGVSPHHVNEDISNIDKSKIPNHSLLVGGFPCQDYSVARSLSKEKGIEGKKGVLWWQIFDILNIKQPPFILLENVDRLIKSPSKQRGRDFGIMLRSLNDLGYGVEWRIINAADYGQSQRRRRIFIWGFHQKTKYFKNFSQLNENKIMTNTGFFSSVFPVKSEFSNFSSLDISKKYYPDLVSVSDKFAYKFENAGFAINHHIFTSKINEITETPIPLSMTLEKHVSDKKYYIESKIDKFIYLKGNKKVERISQNGIKYNYSEGAMSFPENLELPGRTMLTSEGTVNRSTHVVKDITSGNLRLITPVEAERLNGFPDNWTNTGMAERKRYFMMGNALVVGLIKKMSPHILNIIENE